VSPLPDPVGRQLDVVHLGANQHNVVLGTAGTGKTTMAMHRAVHLADPATANHGTVLLVTFNNTLVTYLQFLSPDGASEITLETYGLFSRGYLNSRGQMPVRDGIAQKGRLRSLVANAVITVGADHPGSRVLNRDTAWFVDEIGWIAGMGHRHRGRVPGRQTSRPADPTQCG